MSRPVVANSAVFAEITPSMLFRSFLAPDGNGDAVNPLPKILHILRRQLGRVAPQDGAAVGHIAVTNEYVFDADR